MAATSPATLHPGTRRHGLARIRTLLVALLLATGSVLALLAPGGAAPADAAVEVSAVRVVAVSGSAFRVKLASLGSGWTYTLYASTAKEDVAYAHLKQAPHHVSSKLPDLTLRGLPATTKVYWFRLQATRRTSHHTSGFFSVGLRPAAPGGVQVTRAERSALRLAWTGSAETFEVQQATNAAFTEGLRTYRAVLGARALTPYDLDAGRRYWFRVRGYNATSAGAYSAVVDATDETREQTVRAMSFNLLTLTSDGTQQAGSERVAPWSQRRVAAARLLSATAPDVVGLQEGGAYEQPTPGARQVDGLMDALGGGWALARTEVPPPQPGYFRIGSYIAYRPSVLAPVGDGGSWDLGEVAGGFHKWAAYQVLRHRGSGTTFLFVSTHLQSGGTGGDVVRRDETTALLASARAYAADHGHLPVVYAGDFNSHERHAVDGPAVAMGEAGATDTREVAGRLTNARFNSSNLYQRTPPAYGLALDHVYVSPGVGVRAWGQALDLDGRDFDGVIPSDHNPVWTDLAVPR